MDHIRVHPSSPPRPHSCWETCQSLIKRPRLGSRSERSFKAPLALPRHPNQHGLAKERTVDSCSPKSQVGELQQSGQNAAT